MAYQIFQDGKWIDNILVLLQAVNITNYNAPRYALYVVVIQVKEDGTVIFEQKNKFCVGDTVEIMKPSGENISVTVKGMKDSYNKAVESCPHPKQKIYVKFDKSIQFAFALGLTYLTRLYNIVKSS